MLRWAKFHSGIRAREIVLVAVNFKSMIAEKIDSGKTIL
jgi:hypothetical protein